MIKCKICEKEFKSQNQLNGHLGAHKTDRQQQSKTQTKMRKKIIKTCPSCRTNFEIIRLVDKDGNETISTKEKKYCTRSCANKARYNKIENLCKCCGKVVDYKHKFCNHYCAQEFKRQQRINHWLETGKATISSGENHYIRSYIRNEQNDKCAICNIEPIWNDKPIVFILDHISGNSDDNSRKNLRLICPMCDLQLDTYKSKNKGNGREYRRKYYLKNKTPS